MTSRSSFSPPSRLETAGDPAGPLAQTDQPTPRDAASSNAAGELIGAAGDPLPEVFLADPSELKPHELLIEHMPPVDPLAPETQAFVAAVRADGAIFTPIEVDERGRIVDGRRRTHAAAETGLPLPAIRVSSIDAGARILAALAFRRQLPKGAIAYLAWPFVQPHMERRRAAWVTQLQTRNGGGKGCISASAEMQSRSIRSMATQVPSQAALAQQIGVSVDDLTRAEKVHALFAELGEAVRTRYAARLFGPWINDHGKKESEPQGLGFLLTSLLNMKKGACQEQSDIRDLRRQHGRLFVEWWGKLPIHVAAFTDDDRRFAREHGVAAAAQWPAEVRGEMLHILKAAEKEAARLAAT